MPGEEILREQMKEMGKEMEKMKEDHERQTKEAKRAEQEREREKRGKEKEEDRRERGFVMREYGAGGSAGEGGDSTMRAGLQGWQGVEDDRSFYFLGGCNNKCPLTIPPSIPPRYGVGERQRSTLFLHSHGLGYTVNHSGKSRSILPLRRGCLCS